MKNIGLIGMGLFASTLAWLGCQTEVAPGGAGSDQGCFIGTPGCLAKPNSGGLKDPGASATAGAGATAGIPTSTQPGAVAQTPSLDVATDVPCGVAQVVSGHCTLCHSEQPKFGAPMSLTKLADFHAPAKSDPMRKVFEVIPERINAQDSSRRMPPASSPALAVTDLGALNDWVKAGAKANDMAQSCAPVTGAGAATGMGGATTAAVMPIDYHDPDMKCYRFVAHAMGDKTQPYPVETTPDMYKGFTFMPPWKGMMYARSFKAVIDNSKVIHHWLFFRNGSPGTDGAISDQIGTHPDGNLVHGWAPGGEDQYLDPDVGEEMPGDVSYMLETHYNNTTSALAPDASGVEVCVTPKVPAKVASISWLGTDLIFGASAEGTCAPTSKQPITIIGGTPHMHLKGRHMKAVINRADGSQQTLTDRDFDFQYQVAYHFQQVLMPGDTVTTTCSYSEPATYGRGTNDEMCYLFTLYYPKLALTNQDPLSSSLHGPDTCLPSITGGGAPGGGASNGKGGGNLIPGVDIPFLPGI